MLTILVFELVVLIFSVMIHEISHGYVAEKLGDPTARLEGRLTLNPVPHIDPFGSIILPLLLAIPALFGQPTFIIGWAKPVPYNPMNLKNPKRGAGEIAIAGPISNILIAVIFGVLMRLLVWQQMPSLLPMFGIIVYINLLLAIFNLVPLPPLDGSKVLFALLPLKAWSYELASFLERYGLLLVLVFIFFGFQFLVPIIEVLFQLIVGMPF